MAAVQVFVVVAMVVCGPFLQKTVAVPSAALLDTNGAAGGASTGHCARTSAPQCQGLPQNLSYARSVDQAALDSYGWLLETNCSEDLRFLICTVHSEVCTPEKPDVASLPPCRSVCRQVRSACLPHVREHELSRPDALRCKGLPRDNCITPDAFQTSQSKENPEVVRPPVDNTLPVCDCKTQEVPLRSKLYGSKDFDYVIRGTFKRAEGIVNGPMVLNIQVKEVLKYTSIPIYPHTTITMWAGRGCICPDLQEGSQYLLLGFEDNVYSRLLFNERSVAVTWKERWREKIKKWERRSKSQKRRRESNHSEKRRRNRDKKHASREQERDEERQRRRQERERQRHGDRQQSRRSSPS